MPRIAESRPAAEPSSAEQKERHRRILRAASRLGAEHGLEQVQMHDVAKAAGVAIATLYRYFPSKTHLFASVMNYQVERFSLTGSLPEGASPAQAVESLLVQMTHEMARRPKLSLAMIQANNQAQMAAAPAAAINDAVFQKVVADTAGLADESEENERRVRLIVHCWYGVLVSVLNGRMGMDEAEGDIRMAAGLLFADR
ncbi:TetR family transcriptional regulator [Nocardioides sp. zg-DK7169]|uniref:TetR family transcriptional regulator n=1 Tax=Nocardioides sp. zg-DK7169 TaxID=2736600 RepID=UPI0015531879|nr:TetR family transcriptional regulator [Nocardioides sp. zg-DK7169]